MKNWNPPGFVWALVLVVLIALIHENEARLGLDPLYIDLMLLLLVAVLKGIKLGDESLQEALNVIDSIRQAVASQRSRGTAQVPGGLATEADTVEQLAADAPPRPSKLNRFLFG